MEVPAAADSTALLSDWTEPRPAPAPATWLELRDTASAIRLAVQMLRGPFAVLGDTEVHGRVRAVLDTLELSTRRLCEIVSTVQPPANDPPPAIRPVAAAEPPPAAVQRLRETSTSAAALAAVPVRSSPASPGAAARPRGPGREKQGTPQPRTIDVGALLAQLEVIVATRTTCPVVLGISSAPALAVAVDGAELLRALLLMVEDVAPAGGSVDVRTWLDPAEDLGDAMDVVFEVRTATTSAAAPTASAALRAAADAMSGRLAGRRTGTSTAFVLRLSAAR